MRCKTSLAFAFLIGLEAAACSLVGSVFAAERSSFPVGDSADLGPSSADSAAGLSAILERLGEPALRPDKSIRFAIRLTVNTTFAGGAVVRIEESVGGNVRATIKKWKRGRDAFNNVESKQENLSPRDLARIKEEVRRTAFWKIGSRQDYDVVDGSEWLLEASDGSNYNSVYNRSPFRGTPVFEIGAILLELAQIQIWSGEPVIDEPVRR